MIDVVLDAIGLESMTIEGSISGLGVACSDCGKENAENALTGFPCVPGGVKAHFCNDCLPERLRDNMPCYHGNMTPRPLGISK